MLALWNPDIGLRVRAQQLARIADKRTNIQQYRLLISVSRYSYPITCWRWSGLYDRAGTDVDLQLLG